MKLKNYLPVEHKNVKERRQTASVFVIVNTRKLVFEVFFRCWCYKD